MENDIKSLPFEPGDHVYKWCTYKFIPTAYQHHGIVYKIQEEFMLLAHFNSSENEKSNSNKFEATLIEIPSKEWRKWNKVEYNCGHLSILFKRSGTCSTKSIDIRELVFARTRFLLMFDEVIRICNDNNNSDDDDDDDDDKHASKNIFKNPIIIGGYHPLYSNSECFSVWCATGRCCTLQALAFLHSTAAGQVKSSATVAAYAASQTVVVPEPNLWGSLFGFTTKVSLISTQPLIIPAIASYAAITVGGPIIYLRKAELKWKIMTQYLNDRFWFEEYDVDVIVACVKYWKEKKENENE